mmetsp:Transcript_134356/g.268144  ORF Transcript_134356/g.268144 Transcript_134356/m.268144 type:complete len:263 (-) Transcript_134356:1825-2613(-)
MPAIDKDTNEQSETKRPSNVGCNVDCVGTKSFSLPVSRLRYRFSRPNAAGVESCSRCSSIASLPRTAATLRLPDRGCCPGAGSTGLTSRTLKPLRLLGILALDITSGAAATCACVTWSKVAPCQPPPRATVYSAESWSVCCTCCRRANSSTVAKTVDVRSLSTSTTTTTEQSQARQLPQVPCPIRASAGQMAPPFVRSSEAGRCMLPVRQTTCTSECSGTASITWVPARPVSVLSHALAGTIRTSPRSSNTVATSRPSQASR